MKRYVALVAGVLIGWSIAHDAFAQASAAGPASASNAPVFNPFATFSLNRFTFNSLGFLQVGATNPFTPTGGSALTSGGDGEPEAVVIRPPYRPPVRSPFRPPPRPPF